MAKIEPPRRYCFSMSETQEATPFTPHDLTPSHLPVPPNPLSPYPRAPPAPRQGLLVGWQRRNRGRSWRRAAGHEGRGEGCRAATGALRPRQGKVWVVDRQVRRLEGGRGVGTDGGGGLRLKDETMRRALREEVSALREKARETKIKGGREIYETVGVVGVDAFCRRPPPQSFACARVSAL